MDKTGVSRVYINKYAVPKAKTIPLGFVPEGVEPIYLSINPFRSLITLKDEGVYLGDFGPDTTKPAPLRYRTEHSFLYASTFIRVIQDENYNFDAFVITGRTKKSVDNAVRRLDLPLELNLS